MRKLAAIVSVILLLAVPGAALAQSPEIIMAPPTMPVDGSISAAVQALLTSAPPADAWVYSITYAAHYGNGWIASVVGITGVAEPYTDWSLEDGDGIWLGTIVIPIDGDPYYYDPSSLSYAPKVAALTAVDGGGPDILLPFKPGTQMMYGLRGVHGEGDYGTTGMYAVDLVGADNMGANIASDSVYASYTGVIDYVCTDGTSVAIKATDATTGNTFVYAHLVDNVNLTIGYHLTGGQSFANLVHGSFEDTCGWASQSVDSYHVHWMVKPASGYYQVEGYTLNITTGDFSGSAGTVRPLGYLTASGGSCGDCYQYGDDPTQGPVIIVDPNNPANITLKGGHIWDNVIMGAMTFIGGLANGFPVHSTAIGGGDMSKPVTGGIVDLSTRVISFGVMYANLFFGGLKLFGPFYVLLAVIITIETAYVIYAIWRGVKKATIGA